MICTWTKGSTTFAVDEGFHLELKRHDSLAVDEDFPVVRCGRKVPRHVLWTKGSINFVAFECPSEDTTKVYRAMQAQGSACDASLSYISFCVHSPAGRCIV